MLKRIAAALAAAVAPHAASAAGDWDGIYQCSLVYVGATHSVFVSINGQPDGRAIVAFPAVSAQPFFTGYGIGMVAGGEFSGTTWIGYPFKLTGGPTGFSGFVTTPHPTQSGRTTNATGSCTRIW